MRVRMLLALLILIMPIVLADNEYGKIISGGDLLITDVDVKVDDLTSRNLEYNEDISRTAYPDSTLKFYIEVLNNNTEITMEDVEMVVTIDDLDLEEVTDRSDISKSQDKILEVGMVLPSDTEDREYDVKIDIEGKLNTTIHNVEYLLTLIVDKKESTSETPTTCWDSLKTINDSIKDLKTEIGSYFEPYQKCTSDLNTCNQEKSSKDATINELQLVSSDLETCKTQKSSCETAKANLETTYRNCTGAIETVYKPESDKSKYVTPLIVIVIALAGFIIYQNKEKWFPTKHESEEQEVDQNM